eukprot:TRINITY_DN6384_c0_g1_i1.p1 TRINITY_DN6384_c0_g1~~TRINITY_DN6384_c0_g1_i1.p1  ORF type:complete len:246 (-),score=52.01 TRINITY_DN6384_c0_g1_i1:121-858(-)
MSEQAGDEALPATATLCKSGLHALVLGATGEIGKKLVDDLLWSDAFSVVTVLVRSEAISQSDKLKAHVVDFNHLSEFGAMFAAADVCFCALGTTMSKAGSREAFRKVDHDLVVQAAQLCKEGGRVRHFLVVSSLGASTTSSNFYLRTKGDMEQAVIAAGLPRVTIFQPSVLAEREEERCGEKFALCCCCFFGACVRCCCRRYRPITIGTVARAMRLLAEDNARVNTPGAVIMDSRQIQEFVDVNG